MEKATHLLKVVVLKAPSISPPFPFPKRIVLHIGGLNLFKSSKLSLFLIEAFLKVGKVSIPNPFPFFISADFIRVKGKLSTKITPKSAGCPPVRVFGCPPVRVFINAYFSRVKGKINADFTCVKGELST